MVTFGHAMHGSTLMDGIKKILAEWNKKIIDKLFKNVQSQQCQQVLSQANNILLPLKNSSKIHNAPGKHLPVQSRR